MAPGPMVILALDGLRVLDVNTAFTAATGWRREEIVGRAEAEVELWGAGALRDAALRAIQQTGRVQSADISCGPRAARCTTACCRPRRWTSTPSAAC